MIELAFIGLTALIYGVSEYRLHKKDAQAHAERLFLLEQAEKERNQLLNRSMARDLNDYRQSVALEAQPLADTETKAKEMLLDQTFGPEWREMT